MNQQPLPRRFADRRLALAAILASPWWSPALAQSGGGTLRIVVPYPAGGTMDVMMRLMQDPLGKLLGRNVIIDNRAGAAGMVGAQEVMRAAPDGNTLLLFNNGMAIASFIQRGVQLNFATDFAPIAPVAQGPMIIFAHPAAPFKDLQGLIQAARANPGALNYSSTGKGGTGHVTMEIFARQAGIRLTHVPYKGQAPALMAVLSGEVPLAIATVSDTATQSMKAGKLLALGVSTREPFPSLPGVPPIGKAVPGFDIPALYGFLAPKATPAAVVQRLNAAVNTVLSQQDVRERYIALGNSVRPGSSSELSHLIAAEQERWKGAIEAGNITAD